MLKVSLEKGNFVGVEGNCKSFEKNRIVGQGWTIVKEEDSIKAISSNHEYEIKALFYANGGLFVTRKSKAGEEVIKNAALEHKLKGLNGTIYLSGTDNYSKRMVTFRTRTFENFLKKNNLQTFSRKDPNGPYKFYNTIYTDGVIKENGRFLEVADATWLILEDKGQRHLYTKIDYRDVFLPIIVDGNMKKYMYNLRKKFNSVEEAKKYFHWYFNISKCKDYENEEVQADFADVSVSYWIEKEENTIYIRLYKC